MTRHRIAIVGIGMAAKPHVLALADLADRVEVAAAFGPTPARREAFARESRLPAAGDLDGILADRSITTVLLLTPPNTHLELVRRAAAAGKHILLEKPLEVSTARAEALVDAADGGRDAGRRVAEPLPASQPEAGGAGFGRAPGRPRLRVHAARQLASAELLRRARARHDGARRRRRPDDAGDPPDRPADRLRGPALGGHGLCRDQPRPPHGDRGPSGVLDAVPERRARHARCHHLRLPRLSHRDRRSSASAAPPC